MIEITIKSNLSKREVKASYTARQLIDKDEEQIVEEMTMCDCQPVGETNVVDCNCGDEWEDYTMIVGNENNYNNFKDIVRAKITTYKCNNDDCENNFLCCVSCEKLEKCRREECM